MTTEERKETAFEEMFLDGPINVAEVEGGVGRVGGLRLDV